MMLFVLAIAGYAAMGVNPEDCGNADVLALMETSEFSAEYVAETHVRRVMRDLQKEAIALEEASDATRTEHEERQAEYLALTRKIISINKFLSRLGTAESEGYFSFSPLVHEESQRFETLFQEYFAVEQTGSNEQLFFVKGSLLFWQLKSDFPNWDENWFRAAGKHALARLTSPLLEQINEQLMALTLEEQDQAIDLIGLENCQKLLVNMFPNFFPSSQTVGYSLT